MTLQERAAAMERDEIVAPLSSHEEPTARHAEFGSRFEELQSRIEWFKQQLFGSKSERRVVPENPRQLCLGEWPGAEAPKSSVTVGEHVRQRGRPGKEEPASELRFDEGTLPVAEIRLEAQQGEQDGEVIGEKVARHLA